MRLFALATMLALGAIIGLSPATAYPPNYRAPASARVSTVNIAYTFTFNPEVGKVRAMTPPDSFDEKGNHKKYKKAELAKLKGDTTAEKKMAGYKSEFAEVKEGDVVQVTISMLQGGPTKPAKKEKTDADSDKPAKDDKPAKKGKWVVTNQLVGKVKKVSDPQMTIEVPTTVVSGGGGKKAQTFDEEKYAATLIVIVQRGSGKGN